MKIAVYGPTGSGKTTIAHGIGEILDLPVIELDALFHRPDWQPTPDEEFRAKVRSALDAAPRGWVCDGNYRVVRDIVLPRADAVVWLRLPFRTVYWRLIKRTLTRGWRREPLWGTNKESLRKVLLSRDSILLWGITNWRPHMRRIREALESIPHQANIHELRSDAEIASYLEMLRVRRASGDRRRPASEARASASRFRSTASPTCERPTRRSRRPSARSRHSARSRPP